MSAPSPTSPETPHRALRVLVVDDDLTTVRVTCRLLRSLGHEVADARDGAEALQTARALRPDAVLLDLALPGLDGYEVARRLREEWGPALLLIALTGQPLEEDRRRSLDAGLNFYLHKPYDAAALQAVLVGAGRPAG